MPNSPDVRKNTFISLTLIGLFALSLIVGYVVGERYLKPRPTGTPAAPPVVTEPVPPTVPPSPARPGAPRPPAPPGAVATPAPAGEATPAAPSAPEATPAALPAPEATPGPPSPGVQPTERPKRPTPGTVEATPGAPLYRVQVGAFARRENASERVARLLADGFDPYIVKESGLFKVRVGAFRDRARADELADRVRAKGYEVVIIY